MRFLLRERIQSVLCFLQPFGLKMLKRIQRLSTSHWFPLLRRAVLAVGGIFVLAFVGSSSFADRQSVESRSKEGGFDSAKGGVFVDSMTRPASGMASRLSMEVGEPSLSRTFSFSTGTSLHDAGHPYLSLFSKDSLKRRRGRATAEDPVILNEATVEDFQRLPGIGWKKAHDLMAFRIRRGRFQRIENILKVKGIGRAMLGKIRPLVRLNRPFKSVQDGQTGEDKARGTQAR